MERLFGTDGVRGVYGRELTDDLAFALGRAAVVALGRRGAGPATFVVGRDPRASGQALERALTSGIRQAGGNVRLVGVLPTPAIAFLTVDAGATSGVVISASHNPAEDNGIKFFGATGDKLSDEVEEDIESLLTEGAAAAASPGTVEPLPDARERYLDHLVKTAEGSLAGMTVVVDCANGAASDTAPELLRRVGAEVHAICDRPDGRNINAGCGALHPEVAAAEVVRLGADAGVAHDGDADRALFADAAGNVIDGDQVVAACAVALRDEGRLAGDLVVTTVMANLGFRRAMEEAGIRVLETRVGDRYVLEEMRRAGAVLGGEQSGHVIFAELATAGDGLLTALQFLTLAARRGVSVGRLAEAMHRYPQVLENVPVADREGLEGAEGVWAVVREAEAALGRDGRVLVRASGTEPLVRVMVEAPTEEAARAHASSIAARVRSVLG